MSNEMPGRPIQHEIESGSRRAYAYAIPDEWVIHDRAEDYGIDVDTEVFSHGQATGLSYGVQIKGTARLTAGPSVRIRWSTWNYWFEQSDPVLVILWEAESGRIWWHWSYRFDTWGLDRAQDSSFIFRFPDDQIWNAETPDELVAELRAWRAWSSPYQFMPVVVTVRGTGSIGGIPSGRFVGQLRRRLNEFRDVMVVRQRRRHQDVLWISVDISPEVSVLLIAGGPTVNLHNDSLEHLPSSAATAIDRLVRCYSADLTLLVADHLSRIGLLEPAARVAGSAAPEASIIYHPEIAGGVVSLLLAQHRIRDAIAVLGRVLLSEHNEAAVTATVAVMTAAELSVEEIRTVSAALVEMARAHAAAGEGRGAPLAYNAAHLLHARDPATAIDLYDEAARLDRGYRDRGYWWRERGACLFLSGRYADAVAHYRTSLELGEDQALPLLADALLFSGEYAEALELFERTSQARTSADAEWRLKRRVLKVLIEQTGIQRQHRDPDAAALCLDAGSGQEQLEQALALDLLHPPALSAMGAREENEAWVEFAIAEAVVDCDHAHAWLRAIRASAVAEPDLLEDVTRCARRFCGQTILQVLEEEDAPAEIRDAVALLFEEAPPDPPHPFVFRVVREGSSDVTTYDIG